MMLIKKCEKKLKSRKGASITFALLLFLVCAVVSSIVVVAGTAAAGRMSKLAEMDQRYYAVTSAVNLLRDEIDGTTVQVEYKRSNGEIKSAKYKKAGDTGMIEPANDTVLTDASKKLTEERLSEDTSGTADPEDEILHRVFDLTSNTVVSLNCTIIESLHRDGVLTFTVMNGNSEDEKTVGKTYQLQVIFTSNMKDTTLDTSPDASVKTVTWKLNSISKY